MGFPPPPDGPPLDLQASFDLDAGFAPAPTGLEVCGFKIPGFTFSAGFRIGLLIPDFSFPPPFPFAIALRCDLSDPIDVSFAPGGGLVATPVPGLDEDFEAQG